MNLGQIVYAEHTTTFQQCCADLEPMFYLTKIQYGINVVCVCYQCCMPANIQYCANVAGSNIDNGIVCGNAEIQSSFSAPEQHWQFPSKPFNLLRQTRYNEATDVFKIPDVCNFFMPRNDYASLSHIFHKCKLQQPYFRPTTQKILAELNKMLTDFQ